MPLQFLFSLALACTNGNKSQPLSLTLVKRQKYNISAICNSKAKLDLEFFSPCSIVHQLQPIILSNGWKLKHTTLRAVFKILVRLMSVFLDFFSEIFYKSFNSGSSVLVCLPFILFWNVSNYCLVSKNKSHNLLIFLLYPYFIFKTIWKKKTNKYLKNNLIWTLF